MYIQVIYEHCGSVGHHDPVVSTLLSRSDYIFCLKHSLGSTKHAKRTVAKRPKRRAHIPENGGSSPSSALLLFIFFASLREIPGW